MALGVCLLLVLLVVGQRLWMPTSQSEETSISLWAAIHHDRRFGVDGASILSVHGSRLNIGFHTCMFWSSCRTAIQRYQSELYLFVGYIRFLTDILLLPISGTVFLPLGYCRQSKVRHRGHLQPVRGSPDSRDNNVEPPRSEGSGLSSFKVDHAPSAPACRM
ncbi:hypothetical protein GGR56DRAFT_358303 [Xylariaceae sp. FL0804]|nr:hypothetical protein GGR56DRAFT_358303 [Xylariaceae sp. FL0804]